MSAAPHHYILQAYHVVLEAHVEDVERIGDTIPIPKFEQNILSDLCSAVIAALQYKDTMIEITGPMTVVGDLHGNFLDLMRILKINGLPPDTTYLFLGDYVDRGDCSLEVITILFSLMLKYPENVYLLRGNHEFSSTNLIYGFQSELFGSNYNIQLWNQFNDAFNWLPLAAVISNQIFCVHGGLSPNMKTIYEVHTLKKPIDNNHPEFVNDLMWSDPQEDIQDFTPSKRGTGFRFGPDTVEQFLNQNHMKAIIRAHQCVKEGVDKFANTCLYTVFSCSNYQNSYNQSGYISITEDGKISFYTLPPIPQISKKHGFFIRCSTYSIPPALNTSTVEFTLKQSSSFGPNTPSMVKINEAVQIHFEPEEEEYHTPRSGAMLVEITRKSTGGIVSPPRRPTTFFYKGSSHNGTKPINRDIGNLDAKTKLPNIINIDY